MHSATRACMTHELRHGAATYTPHKQVVHTALEQESVFSAYRLSLL